MARKITHTQIRQHLGHGQGNRKVRVKQNGEIHYYGSTTDTDRQHDYWHYAGMVEEIEREIKQTGGVI